CSIPHRSCSNPPALALTPSAAQGDNPGPMRFILILFLLACGTAGSPAAGSPKHVVVVVWDGMRPDFVSESNTPALHALAKRGVFFQNNHSVYLSSTEV